jgi:hypothetical protein
MLCVDVRLVSHGLHLTFVVGYQENREEFEKIKGKWMPSARA